MIEIFLDSRQEEEVSLRCSYYSDKKFDCETWMGPLGHPQVTVAAGEWAQKCMTCLFDKAMPLLMVLLILYLW